MNRIAVVDHEFHVLTLEGKRVPEVEHERVLRIDEELLRQGFVQAEVLRQLLEVRWVDRGRAWEQQLQRIARDHPEQEEVEDHDEGKCQQRQQHLAEDVPARPHPGFFQPPSRRGLNPSTSSSLPRP